jgi:hypothetical protein
MDRIDAAIAGATKLTPVTMTSADGTFGDSGRPFELKVPSDLTGEELGALVELLVRIRVAGQRQATGPQLVRA